MSLTKEKRDALPDDAFAVPGKRKMPIRDTGNDKTHVRLAWDMVERTSGLSSDERAEARRRIIQRANEVGVDTKDWHITASIALHAMAVLMPVVPDHPNRLPFSGTMTFVDRPSDNAVGGTTGKRTFIPREVAEAALPSLLGMAVDFKPEFDGHNKTSKIGIITEALIVGDELKISGFLYAADFPQECERIQREKDALGFSYAAQARILDQNADPWVLETCTFTGAAILYKDKAAYTETSLAASAAEEDAMTPEELKKLNESIAALSASVAGVVEKVTKIEQTTLEAGAMRDKVKPHAEALRSCAAAMEAAGIGTHATQGHVNTLRHMAASMEADAARGDVPHVYRDHDYLTRTMEAGAAAGAKAAALDPETKKQIETLSASMATITTTLADLQAKGFKNADQPDRKTFSAEVVKLLDKHSLTAAASEGKLTVEMVDKALEGLPTIARTEQKLKLMASGALAAPKAA